MLSASESQYDRYELEILQVIKEGVQFVFLSKTCTVQHTVCAAFVRFPLTMCTGSDVGLKEKDTRVFLSHAGCRAGLNLLKGQDYLIIGLPTDVWQAGSDKNG